MKKIFLIAAMATISVCSFAQKFAHVTSQELVQLSPEADQARATITAATKEYTETYQTMVEEFNTKYSQYQQKASTWTPAIREAKEKEITDVQQRIQEYGQTAQAELQQREQELYAPIYEKVNTTIQDIAKQGGYIYVFDKSTLVYIDETQSTDLTPACRKALNIADDRTLETLAAEIQAQNQTE